MDDDDSDDDDDSGDDDDDDDNDDDNDDDDNVMNQYALTRELHACYRSYIDKNKQCLGLQINS